MVLKSVFNNMIMKLYYIYLNLLNENRCRYHIICILSRGLEYILYRNAENIYYKPVWLILDS